MKNMLKINSNEATKFKSTINENDEELYLVEFDAEGGIQPLHNTKGHGMFYSYRKNKIKPIILKKDYTKHTTAASKLTDWIEVPVKELVDLCNYEIKYEKITHKDYLCPICQMDFYENMLNMNGDELNIMNEAMIKGNTEIDVVKLSKCDNHFYHKICIEKLLKNSSSLECPICGIIYGTLIGDMPEGKMDIKYQTSSCDGNLDCGTIQIIYEIQSGKRNGIYYDGIRRRSYLPNNKEGKEILKLLEIAFKRRLTFTIGTSITTGKENVIVWNGIHHKTKTSGGPIAYGFPDPNYFLRVKQELAAKGIY